MVMNCMGWQRQEVVTIDTPSGNPAKKQRKSEEVVQQDSKGNILGTARYKVRGSQESCYSILFTSGCPVRWFRFKSSIFFYAIFFFLYVAMVTVPSYGYAIMKPLKCDNPCSIETKSDGPYVLRNEFVTAEIDHLGRITALTLKGGERYSRLGLLTTFILS